MLPQMIFKCVFEEQQKNWAYFLDFSSTSRALNNLASLGGVAEVTINTGLTAILSFFPGWYSPVTGADRSTVKREHHEELVASTDVLVHCLSNMVFIHQPKRIRTKNLHIHSHLKLLPARKLWQNSQHQTIFLFTPSLSSFQITSTAKMRPFPVSTPQARVAIHWKSMGTTPLSATVPSRQQQNPQNPVLSKPPRPLPPCQKFFSPLSAPIVPPKQSQATRTALVHHAARPRAAQWAENLPV